MHLSKPGSISELRNCATLIATITVLDSATALAITGGADIQDAERPSAGIVSVHKAGGLGYGSGTLIESDRFNDQGTSKLRYVLTVAHNFNDFEEGDELRFYPKGASGTKVTPTQFFRHPNYSETTCDNWYDIALLELPDATALDGIVASPLGRTQLACTSRSDPPANFCLNDQTTRAVGFGRPQPPQTPQTFPANIQKRRGDFGDKTYVLDRTSWSVLQETTGSQQGDSGGPVFLGTTGADVIGVIQGGAESSMNPGTYSTRSTAVFPQLDWIDSMTRDIVVYDDLRIGGALVDDFEGFHQTSGINKGLKKGWAVTAVEHTTGAIPVADSGVFRFLEAVAFDDDGGPKTKTFNGNSTDVDVDEDTFRIPSHGYTDNEGVVRFSSTGSSPGTFVKPCRDYYIEVVDANHVKLRAEPGGDAIDLSSTGSGMHTLTAQNGSQAAYESGEADGVAIKKTFPGITASGSLTVSIDRRVSAYGSMDLGVQVGTATIEWLPARPASTPNTFETEQLTIAANGTNDVTIYLVWFPGIEELQIEIPALPLLGMGLLAALLVLVAGREIRRRSLSRRGRRSTD